MRTRSHSYLPSPPTSSPPPVFHKRKRSRPSSAASPQTNDEHAALSPSSNSSPTSDVAAGVHTPRKVKRVRFSDPGPVEADALGISSTGLTPSLRKARLSQDAARRRTLPSRLEHSSSPPPPSDEIQFLPLRQVLDNRLKRRLRRNHLSETVNDLAQEEKDERKARRELDQLRASGQHHEETIKELMFELESQRQLGIVVNTEEEAERSAMHDELQRLKFELLHHQDNQTRRPPRERLPVGAPTEVASDTDDFPSSPTRTSSPFRFDDFDAPSSPPRPTGHNDNHMGVQTDLPDLIAERNLANLSKLQTQLTRANRETADAKAALRTLKSELGELGFAPAHASPDEHIAAIHAAFRATRLDLERLLPGETPAGFSNATLLPALTNHIRRAQHAAADAAASHAALADEHAALRGNFNATVAKAADLDARTTVLLAQRADAVADAARKAALLDDLHLAAEARAGLLAARDATIEQLQGAAAGADSAAAARVGALETEAAQQATSIARLQAALETWRGEAAGLEALVHELEGGKAAAEARRGTVEEMLAGTRAVLEGFVVKVREGRERWSAEVGGACSEAEDFLRRGTAL